MSDGLAPPDGGTLINLIVPANQLAAKQAEAETLPKVPLTDVDVNWLQVRTGDTKGRGEGGGGVHEKRVFMCAWLIGWVGVCCVAHRAARRPSRALCGDGPPLAVGRRFSCGLVC
jgi:hypothetical protein